MLAGRFQVFGRIQSALPSHRRFAPIEMSKQASLKCIRGHHVHNKIQDTVGDSCRYSQITLPKPRSAAGRRWDLGVGHAHSTIRRFHGQNASELQDAPLVSKHLATSEDLLLRTSGSRPPAMPKSARYRNATCPRNLRLFGGLVDAVDDEHSARRPLRFESRAKRSKNLWLERKSEKQLYLIWIRTAGAAVLVVKRPMRITNRRCNSKYAQMGLNAHSGRNPVVRDISV